MKYTIVYLITAMLCLVQCDNIKTDRDEIVHNDLVSRGFDIAQQQLSNAIEQYHDITKFPRSTNPDGSLHTRPASNWASGFFPGALWYMYEYSNDPKFREAAAKWTEALSDQQFNTRTHDVGFIVNSSYGNGLRIASEEKYVPVLIQTANSLLSRYSPQVGCTKSWDWSNEWKFPVIVDNMMNLELLFLATNLTGDSTYRNAAIDHARTTINNHYRPDYSSYHVVDYDTLTGEVLEKVTHQGANAESSWSRGQAWGLYGFTVCYRETNDPAFLRHAEAIAGFLIKHPATPSDFIPYWDFNAVGIPNEPRDASAAAIIASALLELSTYSVSNSEMYRSYAECILSSLVSDRYIAAPGRNNNFILMHGTGNKPADSEVDVPLIFGDYYFLEALLRYNDLKQ